MMLDGEQDSQRTSERLKKGFRRIGIVLGLVAAIAGGVVGGVVGTVIAKENLQNEKVKLLHELKRRNELDKRPPWLEEKWKEAAGLELRLQLLRSDAQSDWNNELLLSVATEQLWLQLKDAITAFPWIRGGILGAAIGAAFAFLLVYGFLQAIRWIISGICIDLSAEAGSFSLC